jgi:hypothetical protein
MPTIELHGTPDDLGWVYSVMTFPRDQQQREQYFAVQLARSRLLAGMTTETLEVDRKTLQLLIEAPSYSALKQQTTDNSKQAMVAGDILAVMYVMDRFRLPEPSMNKAKFVAQEFAKKATYGDGSKMNISERKIIEAWDDYRDVAHLWGAFRLNGVYPYAPDREIFTPKHLGTFLGVAAALYDFGKSFVPFRARPRVPILDPESAWKLPPRIAPKHLNSNTRPTLLERTLQRYRAQTKSQ